MLNRWSLSQGALKKRLVLSLLMNNLLAGSVFVHALNANESSEIKIICPRCRVKVFPNGVDLEQFNNPPPHGIFRFTLESLGDRSYALF
jgi:hypothetical protein